MLLYRKEPIHLQMKNIMLLDDIESEGVVYISKATYDQALLLHGRFDGNVQRVIAALKNAKTEVYITIPGLKDMINKMATTMPEPINILAPFLMFTAQNQGIDWTDASREKAYGILHQFSQLVDFNAITLVPAEVRANITVPTVILNQYTESWDELCSTLLDRVVATPVQAIVAQPVSTVLPTTPATPIAATTTPTAQQSPEPVSTTEEEVEGDSMSDEAFAALMAKWEAADKEAEEQSKKASVSTSSDSLVSDKQAEEMAECNAILDEYDC